MTRVLDAEAVIRATDKTGGVFQRIADKIRRMAAAAKSAGRLGDIAERGAMRAQGAAAASSRMLAIPATRFLAPAAAAAALVSSTKRFASAEMALTRIGITANATDQEITDLHKTVRDLSFDSAKPFDEVADGLDQLVAGGVDLSKAKQAIGPIVKTAQAAGAEIRDISNSSLALTQNLEIAEDKMQRAFDVLVAGGKAGKFELKDMARYLPSIAPAAAAVGMKGEEGLKRIVTLLQVVRAGSGNAEEAAASVQNIFAKMESEETATKFEKFGVDLRKEMAKARKEGRDLLEVFSELTEKATKGDASKLPQLISDMQFARGMRALQAYGDLAKQVRGELDNAAGSAMTDFDRVMKRSKTSVDQVAESIDRAKDAIGRLMVAAGATRGMDNVSSFLQQRAAELEKPAEERARNIADRREINRLTGSIEDDRNAIQFEKSKDGWRFGRGSDAKVIDSINKRIENAKIERELLDQRLRTNVNSAPPELFNDAEIKRWREEAIAARENYIGPRPPKNLPGVPLPAADPRGSGRGLVSGALLNSNADFSALAEKINSRPVEAELKGAATVSVQVDVKAGDGLLATIRNTMSSMVGHLKSGGAPSSGSTGSNGKSMPESKSPM